MRKLIVGFVFLGALAAGWATAPQTAECRMCNVKKCFHDSACGRLCSCVWPGGKTRKAGICMQTSESDSDHDRDDDESSSSDEG